MARVVEWLLLLAARLLLKPCTTLPDCAGCSPQRIYISNHSSHLDAVLLLAALPAPLRRSTRPVAAEEYWTAGPVRRYLIRSVFRGVLLDRTGAQLNPLEPAASALRRGDSLLFFPEGTRGPGESLQPLKSGIAHLARWFPDVDIVPVWIANPRGTPAPFSRSITFGKPFRWKEGQRQDDFLVEVRQRLEGLRPPLHDEHP